MSLSNIKVNNKQVVGVDDEPVIDSENLLKSGGVVSYIDEEVKDKFPYIINETIDIPSTLDIADASGNVLTRFYEGHIQTKYFDSSYVVNKVNKIDTIDKIEEHSNLVVVDSSGYVLTKFEDGHI